LRKIVKIVRKGIAIILAHVVVIVAMIDITVIRFAAILVFVAVDVPFLIQLRVRGFGTVACLRFGFSFGLIFFLIGCGSVLVLVLVLSGRTLFNGLFWCHPTIFLNIMI